MNLPETINRQLTGDVVLQIADILAEPTQRVRNALSSAVPTILAAVAQRSTQHDGEEQVAELVHQRDPQLIERFPELLRDRQIHSLMETGSGSLLYLLGRDKLNALVVGVSRASSLSTNATRNLVGLITPVVFAAIARYAPSTSASEISNFLVSQTERIRDALPQRPPVQEPALEETDYDAGAAATSFDDAMHGEATIPRQEWVPSQHGQGGPLGSERPPGPQEVHTAEPDSNGSWTIPILILLLLAGSVVWLIWPRQTPNGTTVVQRNTPAPAVAPQATNPPSPAAEPGARPAGAQLPAGDTPAPISSAGSLRSDEVLAGLGDATNTPAGRQLASVLDDLSSTIGSIHDSASASAAATKLKEVNQRLDQIAPTLSQLPAGDSARLRAALAGVKPRLDNALKPLANIPGVQDQVRPEAQQTIAKFEQMSH